MAEWLYEAGIGENRAALVEDGAIIEAIVELPGNPRTGAVLEAQLTTILVPGRRGIVRFEDGDEGLLEPLPPHFTEGAAFRVEIVREPIPEPGRAKLAKCRVSDATAGPGPDLRQRLSSSRLRVLELPAFGVDLLEQAGWSELLEQAASGEIPFPSGALRMSLTPAMTLLDVDGALDPPALAIAGAAAAGAAIRRLGIGGSIGIDLPTLAGKADRQAAAAALDAVLPQPFERTAVNGFGFLQIVRRRERASLAEVVQYDPAGAAARALLRRAERGGGAGLRTLVAAPLVIARLEEHPEWLALLARRVGAEVALRADPALAISAGHVHAAQA